MQAPGQIGRSGRLGLQTSTKRMTLLQQAIAAIRRNNGALIMPAANVLGDGAPNLLSAPEDFGAVAWTKDGTAVTANAATAPDGTATADRLVPSASSVLHRVLQNGVPVAGSTGAQSIRVKADGYNKIALREAHTSGNYAAFDLSSGTLLESTAAGQSITALGGGWFSCSMTVTGAATQALSLHVLPASYTTGAPTSAWSGDGTSGIYIWGAKLEPGSVATAYTPQSVLRQRGSFVDSAGTTPVTVVGDVLGLITDRTGGSAVATQATTANKPTVQRPVANNVIRFDSSNDSLSVNLASGGSPFVRTYTRTGTVSGFTSATTSAFVLGQPTVAGRDVCAIVCAPSSISGADLTAIERWAASIGATL